MPSFFVWPAAETCTVLKLTLKMYFCSLEKHSFNGLFTRTSCRIRRRVWTYQQIRNSAPNRLLFQALRKTRKHWQGRGFTRFIRSQACQFQTAPSAFCVALPALYACACVLGCFFRHCAKRANTGRAEVLRVSLGRKPAKSKLPEVRSVWPCQHFTHELLCTSDSSPMTRHWCTCRLCATMRRPISSISSSPIQNRGHKYSTIVSTAAGHSMTLQT